MTGLVVENNNSLEDEIDHPIEKIEFKVPNQSQQFVLVGRVCIVFNPLVDTTTLDTNMTHLIIMSKNKTQTGPLSKNVDTNTTHVTRLLNES